MKQNDIYNGVITNVTPDWAARHTVIDDTYRDSMTPCPLGLAPDGGCFGTCMYEKTDPETDTVYCTCPR